MARQQRFRNIPCLSEKTPIVPISPTYEIGEEIEGKDLVPADVGKAQGKVALMEYKEELRSKPKEHFTPIEVFVDAFIKESPVGIIAGLTGQIPAYQKVRSEVAREKRKTEADIGSGLGTLFSFMITAGILQSLKVPVLVTEAAIKATKYPKLARMLATGTIGAANFATFSAIRGLVPYVGEDKPIDLEYFEDVGKSALFGASLGFTAGFKQPLASLGAFAIGAGSGKLAGQSNEDALLTGAMYSVFSIMNAKNAKKYDKAVAYAQSVNALSKKLSESKIMAVTFGKDDINRVSRLIMDDLIAKNGGYENFKSNKFDNFTKNITKKIQFIKDANLKGKADITSIVKYFKETKIPTEAVEIIQKFKTPEPPKTMPKVEKPVLPVKLSEQQIITNVKKAGAEYIDIADGLIYLNIIEGEASGATVTLKVGEATLENIQKIISNKQKEFLEGREKVEREAKKEIVTPAKKPVEAVEKPVAALKPEVEGEVVPDFFRGRCSLSQISGLMSPPGFSIFAERMQVTVMAKIQPMARQRHITIGRLNAYSRIPPLRQKVMG